MCKEDGYGKAHLTFHHLVIRVEEFPYKSLNLKQPVIFSRNKIDI